MASSSTTYVISLFYLSLLGFVFADDYCTPPTKTCGPFIPVLPRNYVAKAEVTDSLNGKTSYVVEYFDDYRGAMFINSGGEHTSFLYDDGTLTQVLTSTNDSFQDSSSCFSHSLVYNQDGFIVGTENATGTVSYFILGGGLLHYHPDVRFRYYETSQVVARGIVADMWTGCLQLPTVQGFFKVDYYWSALNETAPTPSGEVSIPLMTTVSGVYRPDPAKPPVEVNIVTHFIWFQSNPPMTDEIFEPPHGVFCEGVSPTQTNKPFPIFPEAFAVRVESQLQVEGKKETFLQNTNLWFNTASKLVRVDTNGEVDIRDYNRNNRYAISSGQCTVSRLDKIFTTKIEHLFMNNVAAFQYSGKYMVRGRSCNTWIGKNGSEIIEWSFLDESWHQTYAVPVQMIRTLHKPEATERETVNFFLFHPDDTQFSFDLSDCIMKTQHKFFEIAFAPGKHRVELDVFAENCRSRIANAINVSPLRIAYLEADYGNLKRVYVQFAILGLLPGQTPLLADVALIEAMNNLKDAVNDLNTILVPLGSPIPAHNSERLYLTALPGSFRQLDGGRDPCKSSQFSRVRRSVDAGGRDEDQADEPTVDRYTSGQLAGLGIGFFLIGQAIGMMGTLIAMIRRGILSGSTDQIQLTESES